MLSEDYPQNPNNARNRITNNPENFPGRVVLQDITNITNTAPYHSFQTESTLVGQGLDTSNEY